MGEPGERITEIGVWEPVDRAEHPVAAALAMVALAALCVLALVGLGIVVRDSDRRVDIPDVVVPVVEGDVEDDARTRLEDAGLIMVVEEQANEVVPAGTVSEQRPIAGAKVQLGSPVTVVVSTGPAGTVVPDTTGQQLAEAAELLGTVGLLVEGVPTPDELVRPGEVLSSVPEPGERAPADAVVRLLVSSGPAPRVVPEVVDRDVLEVLAEVGRLGLLPEVEDVVDEEVPEGTVLSVDPPAGSEVPRGATVTLQVVSPPPEATVPSVTGLLEASASSAMSSASLGVRVRRVDVPLGDPGAGRVLRQGVPAGVDVPVGTIVEVVVGVEVQPTTTVPSGSATTTTVP